MRYAIQFFVQARKLWKKDEHGRHKLVAWPESHLTILRSTHDDLAHKGFFATYALIFRTLLVAGDAIRHRVVYSNLSPLSAATNPQRPHTASRRHTCASLRKDVRRHHAYA